MVSLALDRAYAELLQAHESACTLGQPLLTKVGISYLRQRLLLVGRNSTQNGLGLGCSMPSWDAEGRGLWLGQRLLVRFRQPAPNQTRLLNAFEEQSWVSGHIDDPLPRSEVETDEDAKRRLHETIKNLNRGLPAGTIRFRGDGTGQGVRWEFDRPSLGKLRH